MKRLLLGIGSAALFLSACTPSATPSGEKLRVAATIYPLAYLAEHVGGDLVSVDLLTPAGIEPHEFEPTPAIIARMLEADVLLLNGAGIDAWAETAAAEAKEHGIAVLTMADNLTLHEVEEEEHEEGDEHEHEHPHGSLDPHVWLDPVLMQNETELIAQLLAERDSAHADTYHRQADASVEKLKTLDRVMREGLASCTNRKAIVAHDAFGYFSERYALDLIPIAGISPEEEPSPKQLASLVELARAQNIHTIFFETLASPKLAQTLAKEVGAQTLVLNPIEGLTDEDRQAGKDYDALMRDNLANLRTGLRCP